jgi:farnesyl-diphosphate farnesyltransferase
VVIQQLDDELKDPVCLFYLILRGLDSVEDDMTYDIKDKLPLLRAFHEKLDQPGWSINGVGDSPDYRDLMADFDRVILAHQALKPEYRAVIADITRRMGAGMAEFAEFAAANGKGSVLTIDKYNLYCHYVAGLVGIGLSRLFSASQLEGPEIATQETLANSMGLFLQKTNIIRDYLEDLDQERTWWPKEIWGQYAPTLEWFAANPDSDSSRACLNHMVTDALAHVPDCIAYLSMLKSPTVFEFCAIPQVMALATLAKVYDNLAVFRGVVKVRKGFSCEMMLSCNDMDMVHHFFNVLAEEFLQKTPRETLTDDKVGRIALAHIDKAIALTNEGAARIAARRSSSPLLLPVLAVAAAAVVYVFTASSKVTAVA